MVLVRKQVQRNIYIHNDIANTARHLRKRIDEMKATGNREGIALDITACLTMLAFTFESRMNFIGAKTLGGTWKERENFPTKLKTVLKTLGLAPNKAERPYSTVWALKDFRDTIAHGKPYESPLEEVVVECHGTFEEAATDLSGVWEACLTVEFMRVCSEDIDTIWYDWLERAGIGRHETITHGFHGIELVEQFGTFQPEA